MKRTAILRRTPLQRNGKPIRRVSQHRAAANYQYGKKRKVFLAAHPVCQCCDRAASRDVHHKSGRYGSAFLDENTWLAVCRPATNAFTTGRAKRAPAAGSPEFPITMIPLAEQPLSALSLIRDALASDVAPEKLSSLLAVKQAWEADEARKAYYRALCDFQAEAPIIEKGDDANGKPYARMDRIWRTIRPIMTKVGLSVTWQVSELRESPTLGLVCHLEGTLAHRDAHIVQLRSDMPVPDAITSREGKVIQNKAQVMGSAQTYAERYATCKALGIVTGEDDDGNGGVLTTIDPREQQAVKDSLDAWRGVPSWTQEREEVFWRFVNVPTLASGNHDLSKLPMARLADVLDLLKRSMAGAKKS